MENRTLVAVLVEACRSHVKDRSEVRLVVGLMVLAEAVSIGDTVACSVKQMAISLDIER